LLDAELFKTKLGSLHGADDIGDRLVRIVKDKKVVEPAPVPSPSQTPALPETNGSSETHAEPTVEASVEKKTEQPPDAADSKEEPQ
jgi:hypothetical protein